MSPRRVPPPRPLPVVASVVLMLVGALLALVMLVGAVQSWWVDPAGLTLDQDALDRLRGAGVPWQGSSEESRKVVNGTTLVLGATGIVSWLGCAAAVWRGGTPVPAVITTVCAASLVGLLGMALGGGVAVTAGLQGVVAAMLALGVVATALLHVPPARRWYDSFSTYLPV